MGILDGKVVLITGAGRGVGRAHAVTCADEGARVVINDLGAGAWGDGAADRSPAEEVVDLIRSRGGDAVADFEDIASWEGAGRAVRHAIDHFDRLDGLVNNAGIIRPRALTDITEEDVDSVLGVHLKGTFACTVAACRHWYTLARSGARPRASVVNTVSDAMFIALANEAAYAAAKAGIAALTQVGSREGAAYGVRMNAYGPRALTRMAASVMPLPEGVREIPAGEEGDEGPVSTRNPSSLVAWLLSDESDHVTGQIFRTLGGGIAQMTPWQSKAMIWPHEGKYRFAPADVGAALNSETFGCRLPDWSLEYAPGDPRQQGKASAD